jgi:hypothetical protein
VVRCFGSMVMCFYQKIIVRAMPRKLLLQAIDRSRRAERRPVVQRSVDAQDNFFVRHAARYFARDLFVREGMHRSRPQKSVSWPIAQQSSSIIHDACDQVDGGIRAYDRQRREMYYDHGSVLSV